LKRHYFGQPRTRKRQHVKDTRETVQHVGMKCSDSMAQNSHIAKRVNAALRVQTIPRIKHVSRTGRIGVGDQPYIVTPKTKLPNQGACDPLYPAIRPRRHRNFWINRNKDSHSFFNYKMAKGTAQSPMPHGEAKPLFNHRVDPLSWTLL